MSYNSPDWYSSHSMPTFHNIHYLGEKRVIRKDRIHKCAVGMENARKEGIPRMKGQAFQFPVFLLLAGLLWMSVVPSCV